MYRYYCYLYPVCKSGFYLEKVSTPLIRALNEAPDDGAVEPYARFLIGPDRVLTGIRKQIQKQLKPSTRRHIEDAAQAVSLFLSFPRMRSPCNNIRAILSDQTRGRKKIGKQKKVYKNKAPLFCISKNRDRIRINIIAVPLLSREFYTKLQGVWP